MSKISKTWATDAPVKSPKRNFMQTWKTSTSFYAKTTRYYKSNDSRQSLFVVILCIHFTEDEINIFQYISCEHINTEISLQKKRMDWSYFFEKEDTCI